METIRIGDMRAPRREQTVLNCCSGPPRGILIAHEGETIIRTPTGTLTLWSVQPWFSFIAGLFYSCS